MMTPDASLMSAPATRGGRISTFLAVGQARSGGPEWKIFTKHCDCSSTKLKSLNFLVKVFVKLTIEIHD